MIFYDFYRIIVQSMNIVRREENVCHAITSNSFWDSIFMICTCTCIIHTFIIHVYRFIYICLAMRVIANDRVFSDLWCCVVVVFAFASPCTGAKYTRHQPPTATPVLLSSRVVGPYLRMRVPPPSVRTNEYRKCHAKK